MGKLWSTVLSISIQFFKNRQFAKLAFKLDCEVDGKQYRNKRYQPKLITVSRVSEGNYNVTLKCQGRTLAGAGIINDLIDISVVVNATKEKDLTGDHFADHVSMMCDEACFNPAVTERDLLVGRVCKRQPKRQVQRIEMNS